MKYCPNCGSKLKEEADVCVSCGKIVNNNAINTVKDEGSFWYFVIGFLVPIVGLVLFIMWKNTMPNNAKKAGFGALTSVICKIALVIMYIFLIMIFRIGLYY